MICKICYKEFNNASALIAHTCSKHSLKSKEYYDKYIKQPNEGICPVCGKETRYMRLSSGYKKFCSIKCSRQSEEVLNNIREGMKNSEHWQEVIKSEKYCKNLSEGHKNCNYVQNIMKTDEYKLKLSNALKHSKKFKESRSSIEYRNKLSFYAAKRAKEGKAKINYRYNDILFASKPELAYYIWLKDHKIDFKYQCEPILYEFEGQKKRYVPDFEVNGELQEIKGLHFFENGVPNGKMINPYDRTQDAKYEAKHQCMIKNNVRIITDCSEYIKYVEFNYGIDFFTNHTLSK